MTKKMTSILNKKQITQTGGCMPITSEIYILRTRTEVDCVTGESITIPSVNCIRHLSLRNTRSVAHFTEV